MLKLQKLLEGYGLTEKEAAVYLATVSLGIVPVASIAKRASIKRPTTYLILEALTAKHLVAQIPRGKKIFYKAESPDGLVEALESRKQSITTALPDLRALYAQKNEVPRVRFYQGKNELLKPYEEIFRSKEIWSIFSPEKYTNVFSRDENRHLLRLLDRAGGLIYSLAEDSLKTRKFLAEPYRKGIVRARVLPKEYKIATDILVSDSTTLMVSLETLVGVVIEDKSIAATQRMFIQSLWQQGGDV